MRLTLLLLLLLSLSAGAQFDNVGYVGQLNGVPPASGGPSYLLSEDFEGPGYQNVWTEAGTGTVNEDYTTSPAPLEGTQSLGIILSGQKGRTFTGIPVNSTVYGYCMINFVVYPGSGVRWMAMIAGGTNVFSMTGRGTTNGVTMAVATSPNTASGTISSNTTYHCWWKYVAGTGANAQGFFAWSTDGILPTSGTNYISTTTGNSSGAVTNLTLGAVDAANCTMTVVIDKVRLSASPIGDNPP